VNPLALARTNRGNCARRRPWRRAGLRREPHCDVPSRSAPTPTGSHLEHALPCARRSTHVRSFPHWEGGANTTATPPSPRPRRHRPRRDGRRPLVRVPSSQQPRGSPVRLSRGDQSPRRSGASPPARPFHAAVAFRGIPSNTLGHLRNRRGSSCA
jgi:hypothetical protein